MNSPRKVIRLPSGRACSLGEYVRSWRALKAIPPQTTVANWDHVPTTAREILAEMTYGMHDRINRHVAGFGQGRNWSYEAQGELMRAAHMVNTPRLVIDWLPACLRRRLAHRLRSAESA